MRALVWSFIGQDRRGAVAVVAGLASPVLLGAGALAVDLAHSRAVQGTLQAAADAAALAASQQLPDTAAAMAAAVDLAAKNAPANYGTILKTTDVSFGRYDPTTKTFTPGATGANAVRVNTGRTAANGNPAPTFFAKIFGTHTVDISTSAMAYRGMGPRYCVYVLDPNNNSALGISGNGTFQVPNCGVQVNSGHNRAASAGNSTQVRAKEFCFVGGYNGSFTPVPQTGCPALPDPLAGVPEPAAPNGGACYSGLTPQANQTYCGSISVSSDMTLPPGLYYFKGATISISGGANISGNGVIWFLDANSTLEFNSSGTVNLVAPSSGTYAGISIFQSRSATTNNTIKITGGANFLLDGTLYVPKAHLQLFGNSTVSVNSRSGYMIANNISYSGTSTFTVGAWGGTQALGKTTKAALVE